MAILRSLTRLYAIETAFTVVTALVSVGSALAVFSAKDREKIDAKSQRFETSKNDNRVRDLY